MKKGTAMMFLLVLAALLAVPAARANTMPGGSGSPDTLSPDISTPVSALLSGSFTSNLGDFSGTYQTQVFSDSNNVFGSGDLTFLYGIFNSGSSSADLATFSMSFFNGFQTDVGIDSSLYPTTACGSSAVVAPNQVSRTSGIGAAVNFTYSGSPGLPAGDCSGVLVVETNATSFKAGNLSVQNAGVATVAAYEPTAAEPASAALLLMVLGAAGLLFGKRALTA